MTCEVCIVCVRAQARVQSTVKRCLLSQSASGGHFGNKEYIESYGKTHSLYCTRTWGSLRLAPIITSECKALWGEPEEAPFFSVCARRYITAAGRPVCHQWALQLVSPAVSYIIAASGPVSHLQFHWSLCFCCKHAS